MIDRPGHLQKLETALRRSPVTALLGPRQCGKTTLAREFGRSRRSIRFDIESLPDQRRLANPELALGSLEGLVILDEIQVMPSLFNVLRVLVDRPQHRARFLILGSASPDVVRNVSESLAGRVEMVELSGFNLAETGPDHWERLWVRGGFPRSYLADSDEDSAAWREGFIRTFLERDIPQLGITIPAAAMRRFWMMLAHSHGQIWNASVLGRAMGLSDKTVRSYLDILEGTFMVRRLQPWHENIAKRQVKAPKVYLRDSGLLHSLLAVPDRHALLGHPSVGASWEGFVIEEALRLIQPPEAFFWSTHGGAKVDLFFIHHGRRLAIEVKVNEAPKVTRAMRNALRDLRLDHLWVLYPGAEPYPAEDRITVWPLRQITSLPQEIENHLGSN